MHRVRAPGLRRNGHCHTKDPQGHLNYANLNLVPQREADDLRTSRHSHSYARIEFQNLREAPVRGLGGPAPSR